MLIRFILGVYRAALPAIAYGWRLSIKWILLGTILFSLQSFGQAQLPKWPISPQDLAKAASTSTQYPNLSTSAVSEMLDMAKRGDIEGAKRMFEALTKTKITVPSQTSAQFKAVLEEVAALTKSGGLTTTQRILQALSKGRILPGASKLVAVLAIVGSVAIAEEVSAQTVLEAVSPVPTVMVKKLFDMTPEEHADAVVRARVRYGTPAPLTRTTR